MVYTRDRFHLLTPLVLLAGLALAGCQGGHGVAQPVAGPVAQAQPSPQAMFVRDMQRVIAPQMLAANINNLSGTVDLWVTLNRANEPTACEVRKSRQPSAAGLPRPKALSALVARQCWNIVYPKVPVALFGSKDSVQVVAPLIFYASAASLSEPHLLRLQYAAQSQFFWDQVFAGQPLDSIGVAGFRYQADASGKVHGCLVSLEPGLVRPDAFKFDTALQQRLTSRCNALDLKQMPGFATDEAGVARGLVGVEYAPWKGRAH